MGENKAIPRFSSSGSEYEPDTENASISDEGVGKFIRTEMSESSSASDTSLKPPRVSEPEVDNDAQQLHLSHSKKHNI